MFSTTRGKNFTTILRVLRGRAVGRLIAYNCLLTTIMIIGDRAGVVTDGGTMLGAGDGIVEVITAVHIGLIDADVWSGTAILSIGLLAGLLIRTANSGTFQGTVRIFLANLVQAFIASAATIFIISHKAFVHLASAHKICWLIVLRLVEFAAIIVVDFRRTFARTIIGNAHSWTDAAVLIVNRFARVLALFAFELCLDDAASLVDHLGGGRIRAFVHAHSGKRAPSFLFKALFTKDLPV